ncbi:YceI family protein [Thermoplasma sp.]|uniref:YceI family protein n=1 Tax=Thermoplasma sp. TaxID=1973142 RepID=UPI0025DF458D|nr:YceI family protein [Thermoplasma sp.]
MDTKVCNYVLCSERSQINFTISHFVLSKVSGHFSRFFGCALISEMESVDYAFLKIDVTSIRTGNSIRDRNLMKRSYFNSSEYRYIECEVKDLDLKKTLDHPVDFHVRIKEMEEVIPFNVFVISANSDMINLRITGKIKTQDFGLKWPSPIKAGLMVGSEANLSIFLSLFRGQTTIENLGNNPSQSSSVHVASHRK